MFYPRTNSSACLSSPNHLHKILHVSVSSAVSTITYSRKRVFNKKKCSKREIKVMKASTRFPDWLQREKTNSKLTVVDRRKILLAQSSKSRNPRPLTRRRIRSSSITLNTAKQSQIGHMQTMKKIAWFEWKVAGSLLLMLRFSETT